MPLKSYKACCVWEKDYGRLSFCILLKSNKHLFEIRLKTNDIT